MSGPSRLERTLKTFCLPLPGFYLSCGCSAYRLNSMRTPLSTRADRFDFFTTITHDDKTLYIMLTLCNTLPRAIKIKLQPDCKTCIIAISAGPKYFPGLSPDQRQQKLIIPNVRSRRKIFEYFVRCLNHIVLGQFLFLNRFWSFPIEP